MAALAQVNYSRRTSGGGPDVLCSEGGDVFNDDEALTGRRQSADADLGTEDDALAEPIEWMAAEDAPSGVMSGTHRTESRGW